MAEGDSGRKLTCPTVVHVRLHVNSYAPPACAHTVTAMRTCSKERANLFCRHQERLCRCVPLTGSSNSGCLISCSYFTLSHVPFFAVQHTQHTLLDMCGSVCACLFASHVCSQHSLDISLVFQKPLPRSFVM